ncbi:MAG: hypothetical protein NE330_22820 [Lentisphaeraceae bacterium]|nr:hypothetical protein [Lentisphaeraceae bacterium]
MKKILAALFLGGFVLTGCSTADDCCGKCDAKAKTECPADCKKACCTKK